MERGGSNQRGGGAARLLVGFDGATRVARAMEWLGAHPPQIAVLVVAASWEACEELARQRALATGASFGVTRLTLGRLAGLLAAPALAREDRVPVGGLALAAIVARAVHRLGGALPFRYFDPVATRPGFPLAVARTMHELRMNHVPASAVRPLAQIGEDLAALAEGIASELAAARLADRAAVFATAVASAQATPAPHPLGLPTLLLDVPITSEAEATLVAAVARRAPDLVATAVGGDERSITFLERALGCQREVLPPPAQERSLGALQTHLFEDTRPRERVLDASVSLHAWPGEARECVEIARRIQIEAARGVPFDRMAILLRAPQDYTPHLQEALGRAAIPAFFAAGTTRPDPSGRALLALLACRAEGLSARRFAEYLSLAQVPDPEVRAARGSDPDATWVPPDHDLLPPGDAAEPARGEDAEPLPRDPYAVESIAGSVRAPWRWEQLLVDAAVIGGTDRWKRRLAGLEQELRLRRAALGVDDEVRAALLDRELVDLEHLRGFALPLVGRLAALPERAVWGDWLPRLRALAGAAVRDPVLLLATLAELEPMAPVGPVELDEVQLVLGDRLRTLTARPPRRRYGAVFVASIEAARGLEFDVVFVPGLAERLFPRKIAEDPILLDAARSALAGARPACVPLMTQAGRVAAERLALRLAVGAARERVVLSYPRIDMEQARPRVPSFYTLETLRAAEGRLPGFDEIAERAREAGYVRLGWPAPERAEEAVDDAEYDLALLQPLLAADATASTGAAHYLLGANANLARALRARARRWIRRWTVADGLVDPDDLGRAALARHQLHARSYSPTALQHFAACPYRFFLQAVHRLQPREEPVAIELLDPLTRGALFHDVQFAVLSKLLADDRLPVRPDGLTDALTVSDAILDQVAARYAWDLAPAIPRVWQNGIDAIRADLRDWLRLEAEGDGVWVPHRFELSFGLADRDRLNADPASVSEPVVVLGRLQLRGSIDLVERHVGGVLRVTDHKTGKARARAGVVIGGGEILQPVLYALACERLLPEPVEAGRLYYCTAVGGYTERVVPLDGVSRDAASEVAAILDQALSEGFLPAAPAEGACVYCDYRSVCGPYEETRVRRKPRQRLDELVRLRSMP